MKHTRGFTLLTAIVVTSMLLLVSFVVADVTLKELQIAYTGQESQYAFYNADSGTECAEYWDTHDEGGSAFATTTPQTITCNNEVINSSQIVNTIPSQNAVIGAVNSGGSGDGSCGNGYSSCRSITFDANKAGSSDTQNFAALISGTYSYLATDGNPGGEIQNTTTQTGGGASITVPADLVFATDSTCSNKLNWEFEDYNPSTGAMDVWVNIGTLHGSAYGSDSQIYECYGKPSVTTWQGNVPGTWDSNYKIVYHAPNGTTLSVTDSTGNNNNGTKNNVAAATGQIDGGVDFTGQDNTYYVHTPSINIGTTFTVETWAKPAAADVANGNGYHRLLTNSYSNGFYLGSDSTAANQMIFIVANNFNLVASGITAGNWYHIVGTLSGGTATLYINGQSVGTPQTGLTPSIGSHEIGWGLEDFPGWSGMADELRISTTARSADQILAEYNNQSSPSTFYTVGSEQSSGGGSGGSGTPASSIFEVDFSHGCAIVQVTKNGGTEIDSRGYNTCDVNSANRFERGIKITY